MSLRILVVAHNHPDLHPGGTEIVAHDLFQSYKRAGAEAMFLAATNQVHRLPRPGTSFQAINGSDDEVMIWAGHFDRLMMSQIDIHGVIPDLIRLLTDFRPDVVEIHHLLLIGVEFPALVRRVLPNAEIVLMLHDYYPICAHDGLMVRKHDHTRCLDPGPDACHRCIPDVSAAKFFLRELNIKTHLASVDRFISPSAFLRERYVAWDLPADRIVVIPNGHAVVERAPERATPRGLRNVFGYFGNLNPWKGVLTLLEAARILADEGAEFEVRVHGAPLFQTDAFNEDLEAAFQRAGDCVRRLGQYARHDIPGLMADVDWVVVPSLWWENSPLTIAEAQFHGRPVITSGIGGMAELIRDGENGIWIRPGDASDLANVMRRAIEKPALWRSLEANVVPPPSVDEIAQRHLALFAGGSHLAVEPPAMPRVVAA